MKIMWCWRCKKNMPMLDELEYKRISDIHTQCIRSVKEYRQKTGSSLTESPLDILYEPLKIEYDKITGMANCHHNAIMHHRISIYGEPCSSCGKPLRTPRARMCAACGTKVK